MSVSKRVATFAMVSVAAYGSMAIIFWLNCVLGGHNSMEMLYGEFANIFLALVTGVVFAWSASQSS